MSSTPPTPTVPAECPPTHVQRFFASHKRTLAFNISAVLLLSCCTLGGIASAFSSPPSSTSDTGSSAQTASQPKTPTSAPTLTVTVTPTPTATSSPTPTPTPTPTPQVVHYPPTTQADLRWLAAKGNASAIHVASSESTGLVGVCPEPRREVWVDPSITGQQLAEDLLAFFYGQGLNSPCGSLVVAYNSQSEALAGNYYTAGRVNLDVSDSSGQYNTDPNATNLTYTLTLDIGGALTSQGYQVTYP